MLAGFIFSNSVPVYHIYIILIYISVCVCTQIYTKIVYHQTVGLSIYFPVHCALWVLLIWVPFVIYPPPWRYCRHLYKRSCSTSQKDYHLIELGIIFHGKVIQFASLLRMVIVSELIMVTVLLEPVSGLFLPLNSTVFKM